MENVWDKNMSTIQKCMKRIIETYCQDRVEAVQHIGVFWDAVVITTADEEQSKAYRLQLEMKRRRRELPPNLPFHIFADPPGTKIGSGGSILLSLKQLYASLGKKLFEMKIILICAGGKSQRLPTASALGKLFLPLPLGETVFHMLDLKLAMYLPFVYRMKPGVVVTCSDDVETYFLPADPCSFEQEGFTAVGISSSVEIGKNHGVFVLPELDVTAVGEVIESHCHEVLQKPSFKLMKDKNAILKDGTVCTDSIFFFDHHITRKFLKYTDEHDQITCEIDAYGDFLQPLGTCPSLNYITDVSNVVTATSSLTSTREQLYHLLFGTALNIIFLRHSNFYHLGTMVEYIDNIASGRNSSFFKDLNCQSITFSKILRDIPQTASDFGEPQNPKVRQDFLTSNPGITVMHSVVQSYVRIAKFTVIEYCLISSPTQIGSESILSNCKIRPFNENQAIVVPSRCCFHTVAIQNEGQIRFVTLVFSIEDDLKWHSSAEHWKRDLTFMNIPLQTVCVILGLSPKHLFHFGCQSFSLWNAKLFPVADTMEESFRLTNSMACKLLDVDEEVVRHVEPECRISMAEILERKNVEKMIEFQENLRQLILSD